MQCEESGQRADFAETQIAEYDPIPSLLLVLSVRKFVLNCSFAYYVEIWVTFKGGVIFKLNAHLMRAKIYNSKT